tara:strand:+ start:110 stop:319 length:210 start_codon:yes stop_codon:yes gene_type:complete
MLLSVVVLVHQGQQEKMEHCRFVTLLAGKEAQPMIVVLEMEQVVRLEVILHRAVLVEVEVQATVLTLVL